LANVEFLHRRVAVVKYTCKMCNFVESDPECTANLSSTANVHVSEIYTFSCKVIYRGQMAPRVTWYAHNDSYETLVI